MKKKILFVFCLFLLTGCSVTYNLDIDSSYLENTSIIDNFSGNNYNYNLYNIYSTKPVPLSNTATILSESNEKLEDVKYYDLNDISDNNHFGLNYVGTFDNDIPLNESSILTFGVGNYDFKQDDKNIIIKVPANIKAFNQFSNLDEIKVNIKTKYKVTDNNADEVSNDTYTWIITRDNYKDKTIELIITMDNLLNIGSDNSMVTFAICLIVLSLICLLIYLFVRSKYINKNAL